MLSFYTCCEPHSTCYFLSKQLSFKEMEIRKKLYIYPHIISGVFHLQDVYQWLTVRGGFWPLGRLEMLGDGLVVTTWWDVLLAPSGLMPAMLPPQRLKRMIWSKIAVTTRLRSVGCRPLLSPGVTVSSAWRLPQDLPQGSLLVMN